MERGSLVLLGLLLFHFILTCLVFLVYLASPVILASSACSHQRTHLFCLPQACLLVNVTNPLTQKLINSKTHQLINSKTHQPTNSSTQRLINSKTHQPTNSQTHKLTNSKTHQPTNSSTQKLINSQTHQLTSSQTHQLTNSSTHKLTNSQIQILSLYFTKTIYISLLSREKTGYKVGKSLPFLVLHAFRLVYF